MRYLYHGPYSTALGCLQKRESKECKAVDNKESGHNRTAAHRNSHQL